MDMKKKTISRGIMAVDAISPSLFLLCFYVSMFLVLAPDYFRYLRKVSAQSGRNFLLAKLAHSSIHMSWTRNHKKASSMVVSFNLKDRTQGMPDAFPVFQFILFLLVKACPRRAKVYNV